MNCSRRAHQTVIAAVTAFGLAACSLGPTHSPKDYQNAVALGDPDGSLTTIVGPVTAIVRMSSTLRFPEGDTASGERSVLMYDRPAGRPGMCLFEIGHRAQFSSTIVKEAVMQQPCDGKRWARFRIAGRNFAFVAHLTHTHYKSTPVTLLEIDDHQGPASLRLVY